VTEALPLAGRVALVAGATGPYGRAIAVALAEAGADLALTTSAKSDAEEFALNSIGNELWALDRRYLALVTDLDDPESVVAALDRTVAELGRLDVVIADARSAGRAERLLRWAAGTTTDGPGTAVVLIGDEADRQHSLADLDVGGSVTVSGLAVGPGASPAAVAGQILELCIAAHGRDTRYGS
jgi:NAD(P)-dependent dehydrogenase (short-subunit alcohol dehydrogenase family)